MLLFGVGSCVFRREGAARFLGAILAGVGLVGILAGNIWATLCRRL